MQVVFTPDAAIAGNFSLFNSLPALRLLYLLILAFCISGQAFAAGAAHRLPNLNFGGVGATADARAAAQWVATSADNQRLPFVIIDKKNAQAFVFGADGRLLGATTVLLGLAVGDGGLADMSDREVSNMRPGQRTTPAGRFAAEPGQNLQGDKVIWMDYAAGLAIHRLRPDFQQERRAQRLATASIADNRISLGCVVVPVDFYEKVVWPVLGKGRSVVYVLPETRPLKGMLNALHSDVF